MHLIDGPGATPENAFTEGNPLAGVAPTQLTADWANMVQGEFLAVLTAAGIEPDKLDNTQLAAAIQNLIAELAVSVELANEEEAIAGVDAEKVITPASLAAAIIGAARAYTRQQYSAPVSRIGQNGSQAVDMDLHQLLCITATGAIALAAPTNLGVGKTMTLQVFAASALAITWDAAYAASDDVGALPSTTEANKWIIMSFYCHKAGKLLLTGIAWAD